MNIDEFLRVYSVRAANLTWFLGSGASAAAGIPTAGNLIWQFKRTLFCSAQRTSIKSCEDLASPAVQHRLSNYFESLGTFRSEGSPEEYAAFFEATYPDASDRRAVLESYITGAKPSYGHLVLAALMELGKVRIVWTLNFDKLIEDAAVQMLGSTSKFVVSSLDSSEIALHALNEGRWPIVGKLHGDFQSRRLKNTSEELRTQDTAIRRALLESCKRYGLIVVGYSGRDESILKVLEEAIDGGNGYPAGLFWFQRTDSPLLPNVTALIERAKSAGVRAELLEIQTFDELFGDIVRQFNDISAEVAEKLNRHGSRLSEVLLAEPGKGWPVIRLNALPVTNWPTICRRIDCGVGGTKEVREIVRTHKVAAIAARSKAGVLAFGSDAGLRGAFAPFDIKTFDCHSIEPSRLYNESAELGLLRDAMGLALSANYPLIVRRVHSTHILRPDLARAPAAKLGPLEACVGKLTGRITGTSVDWSEALTIKLDYRLNRLWVLMEPTVDFGKPSTREEQFACANFVREKLATRYNRQWNALIDAWIGFLIEDRQEHQIHAFQINDGIDASFTFTRVTAFTRRALSAR